jgi:hypothetical protein
MTLAELDAEIARMDKFLRWLKQDTINELLEELATQENPYMRDLLEGKLAEVRAMPPDL